MITPMMREAIICWEMAYPSALFAGFPGKHTLDMVLDAEDMTISSRRLMVVWSDRLDPRRNYFEWFSGWTGYPAGPKRWDFSTGAVHSMTNDYEWHQSIRFISSEFNHPTAYDALVSIVTGESRTTWITRVGTVL